MSFEPLKVGDLARRTGLTIRTLHHYDEIDLLKPSLRTESGHRLYAAAEVARLQQIVSLRQLGFTLDEIRDCLDRPGYSLLEVIRMHTARLREQIESQRKLCARLEALDEHLSVAGYVAPEEFLQTIEVMTMIENYYTPEQLESLRQRREAPCGDEMVRQGTADWAELMAQFTAEMNHGADPADPRVQALELRRQQLVSAFTGGDKGIEQNLKKMWTEQGDKLASQFGYDPKLMAYLSKVAEAAKK